VVCAVYYLELVLWGVPSRRTETGSNRGLFGSVPQKITETREKKEGHSRVTQSYL